MSSFDSVNPARPAEVVGTFEAADAAAVDEAVNAATEAQSGRGPRCRSRPGPR